MQVYVACGQKKVSGPDWWKAAALLHLFNFYSCLRDRHTSAERHRSHSDQSIFRVLFSFIICSTIQPHIMQGICRQQYLCQKHSGCGPVVWHCCCSWPSPWRTGGRNELICFWFLLAKEVWEEDLRFHCVPCRRCQRSDRSYRHKKCKTRGSALHSVRNTGLAVASCDALQAKCKMLFINLAGSILRLCAFA